MLRRLPLLLAALLPAGAGEPALAMEMAFRCFNVSGTIIAAPDWKPIPDGFSNASVLLHFTGTGIGYVTGFDGTRYPGFETTMNGGFAIIVLGQEFTETYAVNAGSQELMMTTVRSGSSFLPNSAKAFRGDCRPAADELKRQSSP